MTGGVSLSAGRCARRVTEAGLGCGASWAEREAERRSWASALARARALGRGCWARGERLGRLGLGSGKREGGSDGPDWVGFWVLGWVFYFLFLFLFYF